MDEGTKPRPPRRTDGRSRSVSRLAVVQALYQMELSDQDSESAIAEFIEHRIGQEIDGEKLAEADKKYFAGIVRGVVEHQKEIDRALAAATGKSWSYDRIDAIMRAVFRGCTSELLIHPQVPFRVVLTEYTNVATAFFEERGPEMPLSSAACCTASRATLRPSEAGAPLPESHEAPGAAARVNSSSSRVTSRRWRAVKQGALGLQDDAALLAPAPGLRLVVDDRRHRRGRALSCESDPPDRHCAARRWRVNLSDLAAKGARPRAHIS
jgi:N utilization substance protein B